MSTLRTILTVSAILFGIVAEAQTPQVNTWYRLESGQNKKSISINNSMTLGSPAVAKSATAKDSHWMFIKVNGAYRIKNRHSGMFLANYQQTNEGAQIKQTNKPGNGALWYIRPLGSSIQIVSKFSSGAMGLSGQSDGATIQQSYRGGGATTWKMIPVGFGADKPSKKVVVNPPAVTINTTRFYEFVNDMNRRSVANNGKKNTGSVLIAKTGVQAGGHWKFIPLGGGKYRIKNKYSGLFMANAKSKSTGSAIKQTSNPGVGAIWRLRKIGGNKYYIVNDLSGMFLSTSGTHNGATMIQRSSKNNTSVWTLKAL